MSPTTRPQIPNCLLLGSSHSPTNCRSDNQLLMRLRGRTNNNTCSWAREFSPFRYRKFLLRNNSNTKTIFNKRNNFNFPIHNHLMIYFSNSKPRRTPKNKPNWRNYSSYHNFIQIFPPKTSNCINLIYFSLLFPSLIYINPTRSHSNLHKHLNTAPNPNPPTHTTPCNPSISPNPKNLIYLPFLMILKLNI